MVTLRHSTLGRTTLDEWSAWNTDLYRTTHNTQKRQDSHAPSGIRTHNPSKRAAANPHLITRGHWDRHRNLIKYINNYSRVTDLLYYNSMRQNLFFFSCVGFTWEMWRKWVCNSNPLAYSDGCGPFALWNTYVTSWLRHVRGKFVMWYNTRRADKRTHAYSDTFWDYGRVQIRANRFANEVLQ
jgi:hypothetical protein